MSAFDDREDRFAEWFGWRPATSRCPRFAAGKRCLGYNHDGCICQRYSHSVLDHAATWRAADGVPIWTGEPYDTAIDLQELAQFENELEADLGLRLSVRARSGWCPGATLLLIVRRPDRD